MNKAFKFRTYATQQRINHLALSEVVIRRAGATKSKQVLIDTRKMPVALHDSTDSLYVGSSPESPSTPLVGMSYADSCGGVCRFPCPRCRLFHFGGWRKATRVQATCMRRAGCSCSSGLCFEGASAAAKTATTPMIQRSRRGLWPSGSLLPRAHQRFKASAAAGGLRA